MKDALTRFFALLSRPGADQSHLATAALSLADACKREGALPDDVWALVPADVRPAVLDAFVAVCMASMAEGE